MKGGESSGAERCWRNDAYCSSTPGLARLLARQTSYMHSGEIRSSTKGLLLILDMAPGEVLLPQQPCLAQVLGLKQDQTARLEGIQTSAVQCWTCPRTGVTPGFGLISTSCSLQPCTSSKGLCPPEATSQEAVGARRTCGRGEDAAV